MALDGLYLELDAESSRGISKPLHVGPFDSTNMLAYSPGVTRSNRPVPSSSQTTTLSALKRSDQIRSLSPSLSMSLVKSEPSSLVSVLKRSRMRAFARLRRISISLLRPAPLSVAVSMWLSPSKSATARDCPKRRKLVRSEVDGVLFRGSALAQQTPATITMSSANVAYLRRSSPMSICRKYSSVPFSAQYSCAMAFGGNAMELRGMIAELVRQSMSHSWT